MAELFGIDKSGISRHIKNILDTGELARTSVVANFATTASDGKTYKVGGGYTDVGKHVVFYNLDLFFFVHLNKKLG